METQRINRILLDTDVFSYICFKRPEALLFIDSIGYAEPYLSFISEGELRFGALNAGWGEKRTGQLIDAISEVEVLNSNTNVIIHFAELVNEGKRKGLPLGQKEHRADAWIAAVALANNIPLATNNVRHFRGIEMLTVIGPSQNQPREPHA
jgi:predicted nucleic acid-binding protein